MLRYFRPKKLQLKLGRWSTINIENNNSKKDIQKQIETNVNWANHDHCGSELCKLQVTNKVSLDSLSEKEMLPYIL